MHTEFGRQCVSVCVFVCLWVCVCESMNMGVSGNSKSSSSLSGPGEPPLDEATAPRHISQVYVASDVIREQY